MTEPLNNPAICTKCEQSLGISIQGGIGWHKVCPSTEPLNNIDTSLGEITPLVDDYRKTILLCAQDLSNEKAVTLAAYATINFKNQIQALLNKSVLEALNKLEKRIEYNQHDMGEMGKFIRVQYCKNFIEELRQITEQEDK